MDCAQKTYALVPHVVSQPICEMHNNTNTCDPALLKRALTAVSFVVKGTVVSMVSRK